MADDADGKPGAGELETLVVKRPAAAAETDETVVLRHEPNAPEPPGTDATVVARRPPAASARTIGRYEILVEVGTGAHGTVYRALDPTIGRVVALKVFKAEADGFGGDTVGSDRAGFFKREAQAAGALLHPGIVTLYDAGRDGDHYYLAMEFIEGESFEAELRRSGRLSVERAIDVAAAVAEALDFAHAQGVVHRDIKPANLMVLADGSVKVADFGIARLTSGSAGMTIAAGMMIGTPSYMSPEQVQGEPVDGRSDLYSLGCVLYESLAGRKPFRAETMQTLLTQILTVDPPPPSQVDPAGPPISQALDDVVLRAMARDRERRYQRGNDLARDLRALHPSRAPTAESGTSAAAPSSARRLALAALVLALVLAGLLGARWWFAPPSGYVVSTSDPAGAEVLVDGKLVGRTPGTFEVREGAHEIEYRKDGFYPGQVTIKVTAKERIDVPLELIPQREEGR